MNWTYITRHRHYGTRIGFVALVASTAVQWAPLATTTRSAVDLVPTTVLMIGGLYAQAHQRHLCEQCIVEMPLDAPAKAEKNRHWLRAFHVTADSPTTTAVLWLSLFACLFVARVAPHLVRASIMTLSNIVLGMWVWLGTLHRRYQPWCPWCNDDDGDDDREDVPTPQQPELV